MDCAHEALVNMLVHNDWTITEPQVSFYSDRIVFTSHGGIPHGMTEEEFYSGVSRPRNAVLMRIFLNLGIVEHTGHGIPMIVEKYGKEAFDIHQTSIDVTLPFNQSVLASVPQRGTDHGTDGGDIWLQEDLSDTEKRVILALIKNPENTYDQLASEMGVSRRSVSRAVASLVEKIY
jgi:ATP-dependent DNA helicase RecG